MRQHRVALVATNRISKLVEDKSAIASENHHDAVGGDLGRGLGKVPVGLKGT